MRKALSLILLLLTLGACAPTKPFWRPDTIYTETSTYDEGNTLYQEVGVGGEIGDSGIRADIFGVIQPSTRGEGTALGGGFRLEVPLK